MSVSFIIDIALFLCILSAKGVDPQNSMTLHSSTGIGRLVGENS